MATEKSVSLNVDFINFEEDETDLGLSFAIYDTDGYKDSLMLARSVYDRLLDETEQGVRISYDDVLGTETGPILLQEASLSDNAIELACTTHRFTLDLSKIDQSDTTIIKEQLKKLNYDNSFKLSIFGKDESSAGKEILNIAVCWYQPDEWEKLKQTADDPEILDDTYQDWQRNANKTIQDLRAEGYKIQKINTKIAAIAAWCEAEGKANNSAARSEYAAEVASQRNNQ